MASVGAETTCAICLDHITCATVVGCGHTFCENCIAAWLEDHSSCPTCRGRVLGSPVQSMLLDSLLRERLRERLSDSEFREWTDKEREFTRLKKEYIEGRERERAKKRCKRAFAEMLGFIVVERVA